VRTAVREFFVVRIAGAFQSLGTGVEDPPNGRRHDAAVGVSRSDGLTDVA